MELAPIKISISSSSFEITQDWFAVPVGCLVNLSGLLEESRVRNGYTQEAK